MDERERHTNWEIHRLLNQGMLSEKILTIVKITFKLKETWK